MKILLLTTGNNSPLAEWFREQGEEVFVLEDQLTSPAPVREIHPDLLVSYNYQFIVPEEILLLPPLGAVNLHISYLPWNRGVDPNPWSHLEDTPKGVSIHLMDGGIDTGSLLFQKSVTFMRQDTLRTSYEKLQKEVQSLFRENWRNIRGRSYLPTPQQGEGSLHFRSDRQKFIHCLGKEGWDVPILEFKKRYWDSLVQNKK